MSRWLLRAYPPAWRARYGEELLSVVQADAQRGRIPWRVKGDLLRSGLMQRLRSSGLLGDELPSEERSRSGVLLVLAAWAAFTVAGVGFAKTAEGWQGATPSSDRVVPAAAFDVVLVAAALGTLAVLLGIVLTAKPLVAFLRAGGWRTIRRPVLRAAGSAALTLIVLLATVAWAHRLTYPQRNGGDGLYVAAFLALACSFVASLALWARAAVVTARELTLTRTALQRETVLAAGVTVAMVTVTAAATTWWRSLAGSSTAFEGGSQSVRMLVLTIAMLVPSVLAAAGTLRSLRALRV